jgi:hypothetical protein
MGGKLVTGKNLPDRRLAGFFETGVGKSSGKTPIGELSLKGPGLLL